MQRDFGYFPWQKNDYKALLFFPEKGRVFIFRLVEERILLKTGEYGEKFWNVLTDLTGYRVGSADPHARIPLQCQGTHSFVCLQHFSEDHLYGNSEAQSTWCAWCCNIGESWTWYRNGKILHAEACYMLRIPLCVVLVPLVWNLLKCAVAVWLVMV